MSIQKPSLETVRQFLVNESQRGFTYSAVGATAGTLPSGFTVDHNRVKLGEGEAVFQSAKSAIHNWKQFKLGWVDAWTPEETLRPGQMVGVLGRAVGFWWLNSSRIIYVINETKPGARFGFAYGTLPGHVMCGEERFLVEWDHADNSVWYDVLAFSKANHILTRIGYPAVRRTQKQFGRDTTACMVQAVHEAQ